MSDLQIRQVLEQMRSLAERSAGTEGAKPAGGADFGAALSQSLEALNQEQGEAARLATAFQQGDPTVGLPRVMVQMQRASLGLEAAVQVRNRLLAAYQEIMNMQV